MTDEEILKRLAEIEGYKLSEYGFRYSTTFNAIIHYQDDDFSPWNPLHDDAQCLALVKKYRLSIDSRDPVNDAWEVLGMGLFETETPYGYSRQGTFARDQSLNRAVCLAIIEAHK